MRATNRRLLQLVVSLAAILAAFPSVWALDIHGHRGARGLEPENTLSGFALSIELGVDIIELDTVVTADDVVVVMHDRSTKPALTRQGGKWIAAPVPVIELTSAELRRFDVGRIDPMSRYAKRFPEQRAVDGARIPTLAEVVALALERNPSVRFNIETKLHPNEPALSPKPEKFVQLLLEVIDRYRIRHRVIVQSFDWRTLIIAKRRAPELKTSFLTAEQRWLDNVERSRPGASPWLGGIDIDDFDGSIPAAIERMGGDIWSPYFRDLDEAAVADAKRRGIEVHVWTVNEKTDMRNMAALGVDGIITDYPDRARSIFKSED